MIVMINVQDVYFVSCFVCDSLCLQERKCSGSLLHLVDNCDCTLANLKSLPIIVSSYLTLSFRTAPAVVFWQWVNQSFNALVNYTNRNAKSPTTTTQLGVAYVSATASAMITALGCKAMWQKRASPFLQVPEVFCLQCDFVSSLHSA
jgi:hypothetical protein